MLHHDSFGQMLLSMITASALAALLIVPLCVSAQGTDPESVVRALMDALNAQDMDAGLALIADDTVITLLPPPAKVFTGREQIRAYWEAWFAMNGYTELSNFQVDGEKATWSVDGWTDEWRALGVAPLVVEGEGIVQDGLLKSWTFTKTDESIAREEAAKAAKAAPAALPVTGVPVASGGLLPAHALVMALGGLAALGGLGLSLLRRWSRRAPASGTIDRG